MHFFFLFSVVIFQAPLSNSYLKLSIEFEDVLLFSLFSPYLLFDCDGESEPHVS